LIVGAAHQPGIAEYLQRYREGRPLSFDPTG
jgi:pheromone shutdown protein TraB